MSLRSRPQKIAVCQTRIGYPRAMYKSMYARLTDADIAFLPSLPELAYVNVSLKKIDNSVVEATLKRCPKLQGAGRF